MLALPTDYVVDIIRLDLARLGCKRVVLLGSTGDMGAGPLRSGLARWGVQVLVPPEAQRSWIASLASQKEGEASLDDIARLGTLLADGLEHGVEAIVCTDACLGARVQACGMGVPTLVAHPHGTHAPVRSVVFDMGGVLFAWDPLAMARRVCTDEEDAQLLARSVFGSSEWVWQDAGAVDEQTVIWTSKTRVPRRLHAAVEELVTHWHEHRVGIEGMDALIRDLKDAGYGIYLLSNAGESFARYEAQLPARSCFDGMVVSCYEHMVKPDARIYRTLLDRYGLRPDECLFVDDTKANVLGARRVGMRAYHFGGDAGELRAILLD